MIKCLLWEHTKAGMAMQANKGNWLAIYLRFGVDIEPFV
jgi:hypothetical protein